MKTENLSLSFSLALFQIPTDPTFYVYEGKEYLVFTLGKADNGGLTFIEPNVPRLLVPKDNSDFARQIKQDKEKNNFLTVFSTSLGNLKFEPDLDFTKKESLRNLSLIIKDNQQVKKSTTKSENHFQITFKVRSQKPGKENQ